MSRENRDRRAAGGPEGDARRDTAPEAAKAPGAAGGAGGPAPTGNGGVPSAAVPAQRTGLPTVPAGGAPPPPPPLPAPRTSGTPTPPAPPTPPDPPPAMPLSKAPQSAVPPGDPGATGRSGGSRTNAPAATPAAPRGRDTTDRHGDRRGVGSATGTGHGAAADADGGPAGQLLGEGERDRLGQRLHHALAGFVDSPQGSVAEAAEVLAEAERELIAALRDRSTALRAGWQENGDPDGPGPDTEQLRLTLRTYREVTERLLRA
ncbi:hypothetical protein [Streptomyces sp. NPDC013457]|uniref:hypothetical protein n=1 Tax=Streptomyces sp. NPDC013457 TaxID=3364866 RepID=UPI0036FAE642